MLVVVLSNDDVGVARGIVFRGCVGELVSRPAVSIMKSWGGYTAERLSCTG